MGAFAAFTMLELMQNRKNDAMVLGLSGRGIDATPLANAMEQLDVKLGRPKHQWFMDLIATADALARHAPACRQGAGNDHQE
jgi:6-phosphofructokinase 1